MQEERISENQLLFPALKIIKEMGGATTTELRKYLRDVMKPKGEDLEQLKNRSNGDDKFDQKVRNLTGSHNKLINTGYVRKKGEKYILTLSGLKFLNEKNDDFEYINDSYFKANDQKKALKELLTKKDVFFVSEYDIISEGTTQIKKTKVRTRSKKLREYALNYFETKRQLKCKVCESEFEEKYGNLWKGCIEIHHLKPISLYEKNGQISNLQEAVKNLVPLCSNCHKILHRNNITVEQLKEVIKINER